MLATIAEISPRISACGSREQPYALLAQAFVPALGFERATVYAADRTGVLTRQAQCGPDPGAPELRETLDAATTRGVLAPEREYAGGWLIPAIALLAADVPPRPHSPRNGPGRGPGQITVS